MAKPTGETGDSGKPETAQDPNIAGSVEVQQLSPALVEFRTSTKPKSPGSFDRVTFYGLYLLKLAVLTLNVLNLSGTWTLQLPRMSFESSSPVLRAVGWTVHEVSRWHLDIWLIRFLSVLVVLLRPYHEESLLVMRQFGIQVSSAGNYYLFGASTRFIPNSDIVDIVLQEFFMGFEIKPMLVVLIRQEEKLQVVFERTKPRLAVLERVWRESRECLF